MELPAKTPNELRRKGISALNNDLGPSGMVRFLQQFDAGQGDYTAEREDLLKDESINFIVNQIRK